MTFLSAVLPFLPVIIGVIVVVVLAITMIKVVSGNEVLVVTGVGATKKIVKKVRATREDGQEVEEEHTSYEPKIKIAGSSLVIPFIQKARRFDVCVEKAEQKGDTIKTRTGVEVDIDWVISFAPNADSVEALQPAIRQFLDKKKPEIEDIIKNAVAGGVRAVISTMTPSEVMIGKEALDDAVQKNISGQMAELGYKVQLYIQEVRDPQGARYYQDYSAADREEIRRQAENITAQADQDVREKKAEAHRAATEAELAADVSIAARARDTEVQKAKFKVETDVAAADAQIAGELRLTERQKELATQAGQVRVEEQAQLNLAALKEKDVIATRAEAAKQKAIIESQASAEEAKIGAEARAKVIQTEAEGKANAAKTVASGEAEATKTVAEAEASRITQTGTAEANVVREKGLAEAEAIKAKGLAEAEAEEKLAEARAAHGKVNFEVAKLEIQRDTTIQVATKVAEVVGSIGEKATFIDMGGSGAASDGSDLFSRVLGNIPGLMKKLNVSNEALNGAPATDTIKELLTSMVGPLGALNKEKETRIIEAATPVEADVDEEVDPDIIIDPDPIPEEEE